MGSEATQFQKGKSGNAGGRPTLTPADKALLKKTSSKAVARLANIVDDDEAFGKEGWLGAKEQLSVLNSAIDRVAGRAAVVEVNHQHGGEVKLNVSKQLADLSAKLPERVAQQRAMDMIDVTPTKD